MGVTAESIGLAAARPQGSTRHESGWSGEPGGEGYWGFTKRPVGACSGKPWRLFSRLDRGKNRACLTACWRGSSASPGAIGPRDKQREKPARERAIILLDGVAMCRHGTAGNGAERQCVGAMGRGKTIHRTKSAKVKRPSATWHLLRHVSRAIGLPGKLHR